MTPRPLGPAGVAAVLAMLMGLQPATTDIYLPALPALTRVLGASMAEAQLTMSALILTFGFGQLIWGPVADRVGRRPVLLLTLGGYAVASVAGTLAWDIGVLIVCRAAQGFAMAGAVVCSRAMVRDMYRPHEGAQVMALALSGLGLVAISGPAIGGAVAALWGWRAALAAVAVYGALVLAVVVWRQPETLLEKNPHATDLRRLLASWTQIARHPGFRAWTLLVACTYGGLFTYLAGSSFIVIEVLGLNPGVYGLAMAAVSSFYLFGTFFCRRWIPRLGLARTVARGAGFTALSGLLMLMLAWWQPRYPLATLLPMAMFAFGHGFHMPCGQTGAVGPFPTRAGTASALAGFVMACVAFGVGRWLGVALDGTLRPFALTMAFWAAATAVVAWTLVRRHGMLR